MGWGVYLNPTEKAAIAAWQEKQKLMKEAEMVGKVKYNTPTLGPVGVGNLKGINFDFMAKLATLGIPEWMLDVDIQYFAQFLQETGKGDKDPLPDIWDDYAAWVDETERKEMEGVNK